ncbi:FeS-binding protein [SAR202 cluster bacterium AD-802-E10_MRT_200m]|nr:FeS-binding protein [SAR202 cluster bacterium AD-802-E10_MRT_200m]
MAKLRVKFTFPSKLVTQPVIWEMANRYSLVTNIRGAKVDEEFGWVMLELIGDDTNINEGLAWVRSTGVSVDLVQGDVLEG